MLRHLPWIILGGIALIAGIIITQLLGAYFYLKSPNRVVDGAFLRLLDAKSFSADLAVAQGAKDGFSLNVKGSLDKQTLSKPIADMTFSFQAAEQSFYGNGELKARDGELYLRFNQVAGISGLLPGALQSIWAGLGMDALIAVGKDKIFPQTTGNLTEADLVTIKGIIKKHLPVVATDKGEATVVDSVPVMHYRVTVNRTILKDLVLEVRTAVKGAVLSADEQRDVSRRIAALPSMNGEIWVAKNDGRLIAATGIFGKDDASVHANVKLSHYDEPIVVEAPLDARPLIELIRRIIGTTLSGVTLKLPFDIPAPILKIEQKIPEVNLPAGTGGAAEDLGGLPDLLKLFYGTDNLFAPSAK